VICLVTVAVCVYAVQVNFTCSCLAKSVALRQTVFEASEFFGFEFVPVQVVKHQNSFANLNKFTSICH
jgi:hypothetical protein